MECSTKGYTPFFLLLSPKPETREPNLLKSRSWAFLLLITSHTLVTQDNLEDIQRHLPTMIWVCFK